MRNHSPDIETSPSGLTWVYGVVQQAILFGKKCYGSTEVSKSFGVSSILTFPAIIQPARQPRGGLLALCTTQDRTQGSKGFYGH